MRTRFLWGMVLVWALALLTPGLMPLFAQDGPSFQILSPTANQIISDTKVPLVIPYQSAANAPVVRFEIYIDNISLVQGRILKPVQAWTIPVDGDLTDLDIAAGEHTLIVKLFDSKGQISQREQPIRIQPLDMRKIERNAPKVRITEPVDGATITGHTKVRVDATDDTAVGFVMVYVNGKLQMMSNAAPYVMPWDPIADRLATGPCILTARASDPFENIGVSAPVTVNIVSPGGRTALEITPTLPLAAELPGIFPISSSMLPSDDTVLARRSVLGIAPALLPASDGLQIPALSQITARRDMPSLPAGACLVVVPVKALPGQQAMEQVRAATARGTTVAPVLAAPAADLTRPLLGRGLALPLPATTLPGTTASVAAERLVAQPEVTAPAPRLAKAMPAAPAERAELLPSQPMTASAERLTPGIATMAPMPTSQAGVTHPALTLAPVTAPIAHRSAAALSRAEAVGPRVDTPLATAAKAVPERAPSVEFAGAPSDAYAISPRGGQDGESALKMAKVTATIPELVGVNPPAPAARADARPAAPISLDGTPLLGVPTPYVTANGYSMVPMRGLVEAKGGLVVWLPQTQEVNAWVNNTFMGIRLGSTDARINSAHYTLPVAATLHDDRTMVPLRYLASAMNLQVEYNPRTGSYDLYSLTTK